MVYNKTLSELLTLEYAGIAPHLECHLKQVITLLFGFSGHNNSTVASLAYSQTPDAITRLEQQERLGFNPNEEHYLKQVMAYH